MLYLIYNENFFGGGHWYTVDKDSTNKIVEQFVTGNSHLRLNGIRYEIWPDLFQIFAVPESFGEDVVKAEKWINLMAKAENHGEVDLGILNDKLNNVTADFLKGREWGSQSSQLYNLLYQTGTTEYLMLALEAKDVQTFLLAYHKGESHTTILGKDIIFSRPSDLSIFDIESKWLKGSISETRKFLRNDRYNYSSKAPSSEILDIYGNEVTAEFNIRSYGSAKDENSSELRETRAAHIVLSKSKIFISHSSADKKIVRKFVDVILDNALGFDQKEIFCTSIEGLGIKSGEDFKERIKKEILQAKIVLQFLSQSYKSSEVCQNEMGAAWVLADHVVPLVIGQKYDGGFIHSTNQQIKIGVKSDLLQFIEDYRHLFPNMAGHAKINAHVDDFLNWLKTNGN